MLAWLIAAAVGAPLGWRGDGSGHFADAPAPSSPVLLWETKLDTKSNAQPVRLGELVCATAEPSTVLCADAATGAIRWQSTNEVLDVLDGPDADAVRARMADAERLDAELAEAQRRYSALRVEVRRDPAALGELETTGERVAELRAEVEALEPYRHRRVDRVVGTASPTPVTDGASLFVLFANGVVARYEADGARTWARWLGPHERVLLGYHGPPAASPRLVGDILVVGYDRLQGLDTTTGAVRWQAEPFADYGTPAVARIDGLDVVITASGDVVRARDGAVLAHGLADLWYAGPLVEDADVYWLGTTGLAGGADGPTGAVSFRLSRDGESVTATRRWAVELPLRDRFYADPILWEERLIGVSLRGELVALDAGSGAVVQRMRLDTSMNGGSQEVWSSPQRVGDRILVQFKNGVIVVLDPSLQPIGTVTLEAGLAAPTWAAERLYHRGTRHLSAWTLK